MIYVFRLNTGEYEDFVSWDVVVMEASNKDEALHKLAKHELENRCHYLIFDPDDGEKVSVVEHNGDYAFVKEGSEPGSEYQHINVRLVQEFSDKESLQQYLYDQMIKV